MSPDIHNSPKDRIRPPVAGHLLEIYSRRSFMDKINRLMFRLALAAAVYDTTARVIDPRYSLKTMSTPFRRRFFPNSR